MMNYPKFKIRYFGSKVAENIVENKIDIICDDIENLIFYLIIAGTDTAQINGISAAGVDSKSREITGLADAEFLLFGPIKEYIYKLPTLNAGVSPALISYVCSKLINAKFNIVPIGINKKPYFDYLEAENNSNKSAKCLSTGKAMSKERVINLYKKGFSMGSKINRPIYISESVPGGTTTAQAIMEAFGLNVSNLVGSSLKKPPRGLKKEIIFNGLSNANLKNNSNSLDVIAALGDPFQAFSLGLLIGARASNQSVILSGGSQMISLILLALEYINTYDKQLFVDQISILTTGWLVKDKSLSQLLDLVAIKHSVKLLGLASCLNFKLSKFKELSDYELGYVKEGVGAGGMSLLAHFKGFKYEEIVSECETTLIKMREIGQII